MEKMIFCNLDLLKLNFTTDDYSKEELSSFDYNYLEQERNSFLQHIDNDNDSNQNIFYFYSRDVELIKMAESYFKKDKFPYINILPKDKLQNFIEEYKEEKRYFVMVGAKDTDFYIAVNNKILFIVPTWLPAQPKAKAYGVLVDTAKQLFSFIHTLNNQTAWFSQLDIDEKTKSYSLMDAKFLYCSNTIEEKIMMENFQDLLKKGEKRNFYDILLYHFLAGMTNNSDFNDIELFGVIPSSDGTINKDMFSFMNQIRVINKKSFPRKNINNKTPEELNLFIRHTPKQKAHLSKNSSEREKMGAIEELKTIIINPDYKKKIQDLKKMGRFNVCIFDDYITHGNTMNAARVLMEELGANKIILVTLGSFSKSFIKRDYEIVGDIYEKEYCFEETNSKILNNFIINKKAKDEVAFLYNIFNS